MIPLIRNIVLGKKKPLLCTYRSSATDATNGLSRSFASMAIGSDFASDRLVVAALHWADEAANVGSISGTPTIGGVPATIHRQDIDSVFTVAASAVISALLPVGSTATVAFTLTGAATSAGVDLYTLTGQSSNTPFSTGGDPSSPTGDLSGSIKAPQSGVLICSATWGVNTGPPTDIIWGNVPEISQSAAIDTKTMYGSAMDPLTQALISRTITVSAAPSSVNNLGTLSMATWQ